VKASFALLSTISLLLSAAAQAATEVISLNYRLAADVLPLVRSTLGSDGNAEAYGAQLIVNTTPERLADVRSLLQQLDTAPKRLLISVDTSASSQLDERGYGVTGNLGSSQQIGGTIIRHSTGSNDGGTQTLQVTEGYPAMIQVGSSVPLTSTSTDGYGQQYQNTQYRDVTKGFYVTATTTGDVVHLTLSSNQDRIARGDSRTIEVRGTESRLTGKLGEWIFVGDTNSAQHSDSAGLLRRYSTEGREDMSLRIKVDTID
jgi:type II secretory pathway component GspD/PulD (secretin)